MAVDSRGKLYIADTKNNVIRVVDTTGIITTIAGTSEAGFSGDNGKALAAKLNTPMGVAVDTAGNIYISDTYNNRVREVNKDSIIFTIAGADESGFKGDSSKSTDALLDSPGGLTIDKEGSLYIADAGNNRVRKISIDTSKIILPLTLLDFTATVFNNVVQCAWLTTNETGLSRFIVERSNNGLQFAALDSVAARRSGPATNSYMYNDYKAVKFYANTLYYRLKMINKDGSAGYSGVRRIAFGNELSRLMVYPNPVHGSSFVLHTGTDTKLPAEYRITDITGRLIQHGTVTSINQSINMPAGASSGIYLLTIVNGHSILLMKQ